MLHRLFFIVSILALLSACDQLGIESASAVAARQEAEGKAVGGACRHAGRAIEDCFSLNRKTDKAAIYAGWREMDDYMRENKLQVVPAVLLPPGGRKKPPAGDTNEDEGTTAEKPAKGEGEKTPGAEKPADAGKAEAGPKH